MDANNHFINNPGAIVEDYFFGSASGVPIRHYDVPTVPKPVDVKTSATSVRGVQYGAPPPKRLKTEDHTRSADHQGMYPWPTMQLPPTCDGNAPPTPPEGMRGPSTSDYARFKTGIESLGI